MARKKKENIRYIHVPNSIVQNTEFAGLHYKEFTVYVALKIKSFNNIYQDYVEELCNRLSWAKRETVYNSLKILKQENLIQYDYTEFPKNQEIKIIIVQDNSHFTRLKEDTIKQIIDVVKNYKTSTSKNNKNKELHLMGIRLYYYYVKLYNSDKGYAYPSFTKINLGTGIARGNISLLNTIFEENHILLIEHGKKTNDVNSKTNQNNKYIPLLEVDNKFQNDS